jgi:hypothetical protein
VSPDRGSTVYAAFIAEQLSRQDARKASLEQRGISVVTSSGALVSLLFALVAALTGAEGFALPTDARPWLAVAAGAFVLAAIGGILTNIPGRYQSPHTPALDAVVETRWSDSPEEAEREVAATQIEIFAVAKEINTRKGEILIAAVVLEVTAVIFLAIAVQAIVAAA